MSLLESKGFKDLNHIQLDFGGVKSYFVSNDVR